MARQYSLEDINSKATGRWKDILDHVLGLTATQLSKKGQPCPMCGGTDRYCFTDKYKRGDYYCRGCGPGNGWTLIKNLRGCNFREALKLVGDYLG